MRRFANLRSMSAHMSLLSPRRKPTFMVACACLLLFSVPFVRINMAENASNSDPNAPFSPSEMINHHVLDAHSWHFWDGPYGTLHLPIILYSTARGFELFSSKHLDATHKNTHYKGYYYEHGHIVSVEERSFYDLSITKNVAALFIEAILLLSLFLFVGVRYQKRPLAVPRGLQSLLEPVVLFVRDDIVKKCIGVR